MLLRSCFADKSVFRVRMKPSENSDFSRKSSIQRQNHAPPEINPAALALAWWQS
jgi:hypothetical protein